MLLCTVDNGSYEEVELPDTIAAQILIPRFTTVSPDVNVTLVFPFQSSGENGIEDVCVCIQHV